MLFRYGKLVQQLKTPKLNSRSTVHGTRTSGLCDSQRLRASPHYNVTDDMGLSPETLASDDTVSSAAHDVKSRADDGGPFEAGGESCQSAGDR